MATSAAAIIAKARRDVISHFMRANAVSEQTAVTYEPERRIGVRQFERLCEAGVIRSAASDRYWIDAPRYDEWSRSRRRRVGLALGAVTLFGAVVALIAG